MNNYIKSFKEYLGEELNYSKNTINTYEISLKIFNNFLTENHYNFLLLKKDDAIKYKAYLVRNDFENKTSSLYLSAVRTFYNYLVEIKAIDINPFMLVKNPKIMKKLPNFLNNSDKQTLIFNSEYDNDLDIRNEFIIEFLYATGIRVSELCKIKLADIMFSEKKIKVMGKGNKERIVYYSACDSKLFDDYINGSRKRLLGRTYSDYLIVSRTGKLTVRSIEKIVKNFAYKRNIKSKVTPHTLRHTFATDLLNNGADIRSVGEMLGHESLSTTQIYTHVTVEHLKKVYDCTHPRNKNT